MEKLDLDKALRIVKGIQQDTRPAIERAESLLKEANDAGYSVSLVFAISVGDGRESHTITFPSGNRAEFATAIHALVEAFDLLSENGMNNPDNLLSPIETGKVMPLFGKGGDA